MNCVAWRAEMPEASELVAGGRAQRHHRIAMPAMRGTLAGVPKHMVSGRTFCHPSAGWNVSWGNRVPGVSLRSTPGYSLCSLREQYPPRCCALRELVRP